MKTTMRFTTARVAAGLVAAAVLLVVLPSAAQAADSNVASLATAPLARGAGYERPNGTHQVRMLQRQLRRLGQRPGPIDGLFGPLTEGAVLRFQRRAGLRVDGLVGPATATHLDRSMAAVHHRAIKLRQRDSRRHSHRSLSNDGRAVRDNGRGQTRASVSSTSKRSSGNSPQLIGVLIAAWVALALALLAILAPRNRANRAGRRREDLVEPIAPTPIRATGPHGAAAIEDEDYDRGPDASEPAAEPAEPVAAAGSPQAGSAPPDHGGPGRGPGSGAAVIGYVTVGERERLASGESDAAQVEAIETFCRRRGLRLVRVVRDVESEGARPAPAPGLEHACQALARGDARGLVVQGLGRLTHSPARLALLLRWLADADRALVAIENELDTWTMAGRKTAEALIEVGDWDRESAQRRALIRAETRGTGRSAVPDLSELHARIAAMRDQGLSLHAIADTLNAEGVPTLRGGSYWRATSVQAAVANKRPTARTGNTGFTLPEPPSTGAAEEVER